MDQLSQEEVVLAWYGLGTYWGNARSQNAKGHVVSARNGKNGARCAATSMLLPRFSGLCPST